MQRHLLLRIAVLLLVPAAVLWTGVVYQAARGPYWLGTNYDPAYAYLLNSLRLAELRTPKHVDHPGTTVHLAGAVALRFVHLSVGGSQGLKEDVLGQSEFYLRILTGSFLSLYVILLYLCGSLALDVTSSLPLAWIVQATPFLSYHGFVELADVKPEPLLFSVAAAMMAAILWSLTARPPSPGKLAWVLGLIAGFGMATKVTALSLCAVPLVLARDGRARRTAALGMAIAFFLCTAPILPELGSLLRFLLQVARGHGLYGQSQFADKFDYWASLKGVLRGEILFVGTVLASAAAWVFGWTAREGQGARSAVLRPLFALLAVDSLQFLLLLKHPYQPHYLLPALALAGLNVVLVLRLLCWDDTGRVRPVACLLAFVGLAAVGYFQTHRLVRQLSGLRTVIASEKEARHAAEAFTDCRVVNYYRSSSLAEALRQGDYHAGLSLSGDLQQLHSDTVFLDGSPLFQGYRGALGGIEWGERWRCLVVQGPPGGPTRPFSPLRELERERIPVTGPLELVFETPFEAVWVAGKSRRSLPSGSFSGWMQASGLGDVEGPYPDWGLPVVRWGLGQQTRLVFQGTGSRMQLLADGRPGVPAQVLVVLVNGREIARHAYSRQGGFETLALDFDTKPGPNEIVLRYGAAETAGERALAVLFKTLRISAPCVDSR